MSMAAIDTARRFELEQIVRELRIAARTIRAQTLDERRNVRKTLAAAVRDHLEPHAQLDAPGLEALGVWTDALEHADVGDVDLLQELLYGIDALVRVHLWRETGLPLEPPEPRPQGDV
jgi:hypothetical protein